MPFVIARLLLSTFNTLLRILGTLVRATHRRIHIPEGSCLRGQLPIRAIEAIGAACVEVLTDILSLATILGLGAEDVVRAAVQAAECVFGVVESGFDGEEGVLD